MADPKLPRPTWKGVLKISLVTIPIKVFPATEESDHLSFNQLHAECSTRIQQKKWCPLCAREVPSAEIVKAYEFEPGRYVPILSEELDAVKTPSLKVIELTQCAEASTLPPMAIDRAYFLAPDGPDVGPASDAYALMCEAMDGKVGIGQLAIYGREYLIAVSPQRGTLLLYTLHHATELRTAPYKAILDNSEGAVVLAKRVLATLRRPLDLADFTDQYQIDLRRLIAAKIAGEEIVIPALEPPAPLVNLHEALTRSLGLAHTAKKIPAKAALTRKRA